MKIQELKIKDIPSILWGEESNKIFIAIHGNMSNKQDYIIEILAQEAIERGYQVLSFDLPEHGDRKNEDYLCKIQNCIHDLEVIINYVKERYEHISVFACSIGAYFSLLTYKEENLKQCLFLSPIIDMKKIIEDMMRYENVTEKQLKEEQAINTRFGQVLYWDYYCYVKDHPVKLWDKRTNILYGEKDELVSKDSIEKFSEENNCSLTIMENGEHFFHTEEQLDYYKKWIQKKII